jgi:hypothetical protein
MDLACKDLGFAMEFGRDSAFPRAGAPHREISPQAASLWRRAQSTQIVKLLEDALGTDLRAPVSRKTDEYDRSTSPLEGRNARIRLAWLLLLRSGAARPRSRAPRVDVAWC